MGVGVGRESKVKKTNEQNMHTSTGNHQKPGLASTLSERDLVFSP